MQSLKKLPVAFAGLRTVEGDPQDQQAALSSHQRLITEFHCYRQLLEFVLDGYLITDAHGNIRETNRSAARLLNTPHQFLKGIPLASYIAPGERHTFQADLTRLWQVDGVQEWSVFLHPRNQHPIPVTLMVSAARDHSDTIVALHWLLRDNRECQRLEEHMHSLHVDLEQRVVERMAQFEATLRAKEGAFTAEMAPPAQAGVRRPRLPASPRWGEAEAVNRYRPKEHPDQPPATLQEPQHARKVDPQIGVGRPNQADLKNRFIYNLLHGLVHDEAAIVRDANILGLDFTPPRAVILISAADYILAATDARQGETSDSQIRRRAQTIVSSIVTFFHLPNDTICAYLGDGEIAVLKASDTKNLVSWVDQRDVPDHSSSSWANLSALKRAGNALRQHLHADTGISISVGIGRYHPGICELARSYQDARAALSLGRRFHGQNGVYCLDGLGIAAFVGVSDEQTKIDLATHLLSPLNHAPELLETLDIFFAQNCCPSATATALSIHRNTLSYRLDKINALTGLNPRQFDDGVQMRLALALRSLRTTSR